MQKEVRKFGISDKRGRLNTSSNPYLNAASLAEPSLCSGCGAVYRKQRWQMDSAEAARLQGRKQVRWALCPACRKIRDRYAEGIVTLCGSYLKAHADEIVNILHNEESRVRAKNPMARIIRMEYMEADLRIETTEEKLAEHLGRVLQRAHQGELKVSWTEKHDFCRVNWRRDI